MTAEIRSLFDGQTVVPNTPCQPVIDELRDLLAKAEAGAINSLAFAYTSPTGAYGSGWNGEPGTPAVLLAAVVALYRRYSAFLFD